MFWLAKSVMLNNFFDIDISSGFNYNGVQLGRKDLAAFVLIRLFFRANPNTISENNEFNQIDFKVGNGTDKIKYCLVKFYDWVKVNLSKEGINV